MDFFAIFLQFRSATVWSYSRHQTRFGSRSRPVLGLIPVIRPVLGLGRDPFWVLFPGLDPNWVQVWSVLEIGLTRS